jgi:hypothetical protein
MILFQNSIIKLDYTPATDILDVEYPDLHGFMLPEIKLNIDIMVDNIVNYDVKKILLDSSHTIISVSAEESRDVATYLAAGLLKTRVQKVARVQSNNISVETTARNNMQHIQESLPLPFQLQNFTGKADAIDWLIGNL